MGAARAELRGRATRPLLLILTLALASLAVAPAAASAASRELFGVSAVAPTGDDFRRMGRANVGTHRMLLHWPDVQELPIGLYDWSVPDRQIAGAASNGIETVPFVYGSPDFAADHPRQPPLESDLGRRAWQSFLAAAARRYGPDGQFWSSHPDVPYTPVRTWQIWNEPNATYYWGGEPSAEAYATLLQLSDEAIGSVDPGAQILIGGLFTRAGDPDVIPMQLFLRQLYAVPSATDHFDAVAIHPYGRGIHRVRSQVVKAREVMNEAGDAATGLWITEMGWSTSGPEGHRLVTTESGQARKLRRAFRMLTDPLQPYGIERVIWFAWRDYDEPVCRWCGGAGLLRQSGERKPALRAYTRFTGRVPAP